MIHVLATIEVVDGSIDAFLDEFSRLTPVVRDEAGCVEYGAAVDVATDIAGVLPARANVVTVIEKWDSEAALAAHLQAPHMATFRDRVKFMVASVAIQVLQPKSP